jgi:hypothetical protein
MQAAAKRIRGAGKTPARRTTLAERGVSLAVLEVVGQVLPQQEAGAMQP